MLNAVMRGEPAMPNTTIIHWCYISSFLSLFLVRNNSEACTGFLFPRPLLCNLAPARLLSSDGRASSRTRCCWLYDSLLSKFTASYEFFSVVLGVQRLGVRVDHFFNQRFIGSRDNCKQFINYEILAGSMVEVHIYVPLIPALKPLDKLVFAHLVNSSFAEVVPD
jgi:hypothetical protein